MGRTLVGRRGFTWVEVVVVLFVAFLCVWLILPAVIYPRAAAHRTSCKNNLKQLGLALHNYHDVYLSFPAGWYESDTGDGAANWAWSAMLLPFLEETQIYEALEIKTAIATDAIRDPAKRVLFDRLQDAFRCPSDDGTDTVAVAFGDDIVTLPRSNYVAANGSGWMHVDPEPAEVISRAPTDPAAAVGANGVFARNFGRTIRELSDGTSNTVVIGERCTTHVEKPTGVTTPVGAAALLVIPHADDPRMLNGNGNSGTGRGGQQWGLFAGIFGINSARDVTGSVLPEASYGLASRHPGGAQVCLGDGTVRYISERIDHDPSPAIDSTWEELLARNDGQVLGDF